MKILFLAAHPDDCEFFSSNTQVELVKKGHYVVYACMTADEYGSGRNDFKGDRISKIRRKEMKNAAKITGISRIDWLGFIDGYVDINRKSYNRLKKYLFKIKADVIFAPDAWFSLDFHSDHMNTGWMCYHIVKRMKKRPVLLLWQTWKPDFFIPCKYRKQARRAQSQHISQGFGSKLVGISISILQLVYGIRVPKYWYAEGYRLVKFKEDENKPKNFRYFIYNFSLTIHKILLPKRDFYLPSPTELDLREFRFKSLF
ncbi:MAG: PIG-L deacetylase family protein [Candidatus Helarchaeota archaeon]